MKHPIQTPSGLCYENESIKRYFSTAGMKDPITHKPLDPRTEVIHNKALQAYIEDFVKKNPWALEQADSSNDDYESIEFSMFWSTLPIIYSLNKND